MLRNHYQIAVTLAPRKNPKVGMVFTHQNINCHMNQNFTTHSSEEGVKTGHTASYNNI